MGSQRVGHDWMTFTFTVDLRRGGLSGGAWEGRLSDHPVLAWLLSCVWLFETPWTIAHQAPLSMGFSRQQYWSGLLFPSAGDSSQHRAWTCVSCIAGGFFTTEWPGKPSSYHRSPRKQMASSGSVVATRMSERFQGWEGVNVLLLLWIWRRPSEEKCKCCVDPRLEPAGKRKSQSCDCKKLNSANNLNGLEAHSPSGPWHMSGLANTLIWGLEDSEHETQPTLYAIPPQFLTCRTGSWQMGLLFIH